MHDEINLQIVPEYINLSNREDSDAIILEFIKKPFDLAKGPLLKVKILNIDQNETAIVIVFHHIICDEWSLSLLTKELISDYHRHVNGNRLSLIPLQIQHKDCSEWILSERLNKRLTKMQRYWHTKLGGDLPVLDLPTKNGRPSIKSYKGDHHSLWLEPKTLSSLKRISKVEESTLFITFLTLIKTLLFKYTSQTDIIVGSPVSLREHIDMRNQIGFYVNTLALRTQFSANDTFSDLLQNVKKTTFNALKITFILLIV